MAEKDNNTELIDIVRSIRAIGDLLTNLPEDFSFMREDTPQNIGTTLDNLATRALVILRYENGQAPEGGGS